MRGDDTLILVGGYLFGLLFTNLRNIEYRIVTFIYP
nr:MAG TPA: hypothetical protein [Caudoviricetes sp.]